ncbi:MAG: oligosaccharide repeat unit polymerase [Colwellia sp.]|nr:oligosaccharide repeat unit polymerase [Colwellia sp.]
MVLLDVMFVAIYVLFPIALWFAMKLSGNPLTNLSVPNFVVIALLILAYSGYFTLYFGLDEYRVQIGVRDKYTLLKSALFTVYSIMTFVLGIFLCAKAVGTKSFSPSNLNNIQLINRGETLWLFFLLVVVAAVLAIYVSKIPKLALLVAITDSVSEAKVVRSDMGNNFSGKYHWYSLFMHTISSFVSFSLLSAWLISKRKLLGALSFISFCVSSFSMIMATQKGPFVWFILGMFFTFVLTKQNGRLSIIKLVPIAVIGLGALLLADITFMGSSGVGSALSSVFSRAFSGGITPSYFYLEYFPKHQDYLLGRSFPNPGGLLPYEPFHLTVEVADWVFPHMVKTGIVSTMPAVFWGESYANFGLVGILFFPFIIGFFISLMVFFFNKLRTSPVTIGMTVWMMLHYKQLASTGISGFIIDRRLYILLLLVIVILATSNRLKLFLNLSSRKVVDQELSV